MLSQPKSAVQQQAAKLFQQHLRHLKGNYYLNSTFEKGRQITGTKAYRQSISLFCATNSISQRMFAFTGRNRVYLNKKPLERDTLKIQKPPATLIYA
jgi:hypothetical protein